MSSKNCEKIEKNNQNEKVMGSTDFSEVPKTKSSAGRIQLTVLTIFSH